MLPPPAIVEEIVQSVIDQGQLSRDQICETWGLSPDDYKALQEQLLRRKDIGSGGRGTGGFVVVQPRVREHEEPTIQSSALRTEWERWSVVKL